MHRALALVLAVACLNCRPTPKPQEPTDGGPAGDGGMATDGGSPSDGGQPGPIGPFTTYYGGTGSGSLIGHAPTEPLAQAQPSNIPYGTILFVTQVPVSGFTFFF